MPYYLSTKREFTETVKSRNRWGLKDIMKNATELELYIGALGAQINSLRKNADTTEESSGIFNKLILKKAVLLKQTEKDNANSFFGRLKRRVFKQPKLICDYF